TNVPRNKIIILQNDKKSQIKSSNYLDSGRLPIVDQSSNLICGYTNDLTKRYSEEIPVIVFGDHTLHLKYIDFEFATGADGTQILRPLNRDDLCKYIFYVILRETQIMGSEGYKRHLKILKERLVPYSDNYAEQRKIASILTSVDEVIENTQKQIEKLQDLKKAVMNDLLTRGISHTEFKDSELGRIPVEWNLHVLEKVSSIVMGQSPDSNTYNEERYGLPFFQGKADFGSRSPQVKYWCSIPIKVSPKNSILLSVRAPVGDINLSTEKCCIGRGLASITAISAELEFLYQFLLYSKPKFEALGQGSTFEAINGAELRRFSIKIPPLPEQKKIASILTSIDKNIEEKQRKLQKTEFLKKSLMQDLLTGKVRVRVN
ncbi:MAG: restriction endonuclease subunit S, partial [Candidatus Dadabacteria bacterium]|nr:restriction endonuclease subunit S [Candidatus Dadabacteria bacterium]